MTGRLQTEPGETFVFGAQSEVSASGDGDSQGYPSWHAYEDTVGSANPH